MAEHDDRHGTAIKGGITIGAVAGDEARQAIEYEQNLSFTEALRLYPKAIGERRLSSNSMKSRRLM